MVKCFKGSSNTICNSKKKEHSSACSSQCHLDRFSNHHLQSWGSSAFTLGRSQSRRRWSGDRVFFLDHNNSRPLCSFQPLLFAKAELHRLLLVRKRLQSRVPHVERQVGEELPAVGKVLGMHVTPASTCREAKHLHPYILDYFPHLLPIIVSSTHTSLITFHIFFPSSSASPSPKPGNCISP